MILFSMQAPYSRCFKVFIYVNRQAPIVMILFLMCNLSPWILFDYILCNIHKILYSIHKIQNSIHKILNIILRVFDTLLTQSWESFFPSLKFWYSNYGRKTVFGVHCRQPIFQFYFLDLSAHDDTYLFGLAFFEYGYE